MKILSEQNRCLLCLKKGHAKINCHMKIRCNCCGGSHNKVVCTKGVEKPRKDNDKNTYLGEEKTHKVDPVLTIRRDGSNDILLMKADINISSSTETNIVSAKALFDSGSTVNFITEDKANELQLKKVCKTELDILPFLHNDPIRIKTSRFLVQIKLNDGTFEEIIVYKINKELMPKIKCAELETGEVKIGNVIPDILISMKYFWRFFRQLVPLSKYLFKVETTVGSLICGELDQNKLVQFRSKGLPVAVIGVENQKEDDSLINFWSLEAIGVRDDPETKDNKVAMNVFKDTIKMGDSGRYIVKWPWKIEKEFTI